MIAFPPRLALRPENNHIASAKAGWPPSERAERRDSRLLLLLLRLLLPRCSADTSMPPRNVFIANFTIAYPTTPSTQPMMKPAPNCTVTGSSPRVDREPDPELELELLVLVLFVLDGSLPLLELLDVSLPLLGPSPLLPESKPEDMPLSTSRLLSLR